MRFAAFLPLLLAACGTTYLRRTEDCPAGYVPVDTYRGEFAGRAISAEGVVLAVRERPHDPQGTLDFWTAVVKKELTENKGYALRANKDVQAGRQMVFTAPSEKSAVYVVMLVVRPSRITTVEIAGPQAEVEKDLPRLEEFISKLRFD